MAEIVEIVIVMEGKKILVEAVSVVLKEGGHKKVLGFIESRREHIEALVRNHKPKLVITDLCDGPLVVLIKEASRAKVMLLRGMPISGTAPEQMMEETGYDSVLPKRITADEFLLEVKRLLEE